MSRRTVVLSIAAASALLAVPSAASAYAPRPDAFAVPAPELKTRSLLVGESYAFDAGTTSDPDGDALARFEWDVDGDGVFELDTGASPTLPPQTITSRADHLEGQLRLGVRVTDVTGAAGTAVIRFGVSDAVNPWIEFLPGNLVNPGDELTLRATGASGVTYAWDLDGDGSFETDTGSAPIAKRTFGAVGVYDVAVRVTELDGDVGTVRRRVEVLERHPSRDLIPWIPVHTAAPPPPPSAFIAPEPKEAIPGPTAPTVTAPQAPRRTTGTTDGLVRPKLVSMRWTSRRTLLVGVRGEPGMKLRLRADLPAKSAATLKLSRRDIPLGSRSVVVGRDGQANVTLRLHRRWTAIAARGGRRMLRVLLLVRKSDNPGF